MIHLKTVNFGSANSGLATVGYTLYNTDGTVNKTRSTTGVFEIGTATGNYACKINFPDKDEVILLWDTGGATPRYATDESTVQINSIQEETDRIRVIWNTLKNNGELYSKLLQKIEGIKIPDNRKDWETVIAEIKKIIIPSIPTLEEIKSVLTVSVNSPVVNISDIPVPDYSQQIKKIQDTLTNLNISVNRIPKDYADKLNNLLATVSKIQSATTVIYNNVSDNKDVNNLKTISVNLLEMIKEIKQDIQSTQKYLNDSIVENTRIDKSIKDIVTTNLINKLIDNINDSNSHREKLKLSLGIK